MRFMLTKLSAALCLGVMAFAMFGAVPAARARADSPEEWQLKNFDHFLRQHSGVRVDLFHDPFLTRDPAWRANHPDFDHYLAKHPGIREQFQMDPGHFVAREREYEHWRARH